MQSHAVERGAGRAKGSDLARGPVTAIAVTLSMVGMAAVLLLTRIGIGTSVDSVAYIRAARELVRGSEGALLIQHAPLYSFLLAAGGVLGIDPMDGARWLNGVVYAVNIFLVGFLIRWSTTNCSWLWMAGSGLMIVIVPVLVVHVTALSEPVFLAATLAGFLALARYIEHPTPARLAMAGCLMSLSLLARYAGAACILAGSLALVAFGTESPRRRVRDALLLSALASTPMALWLLRNMTVASSATGRTLSFHPVGTAHAWQALYTVSGWLLVPQAAPDVVRFIACLVLAGLLALAAVRAIGSRTPIPVPIRVLTLFVVVYGLFLTVSISIVDANTPLDDRILLPVLVSMIVIVSFVLDTLAPLARRMPPLPWAVAAAVVFLMGGHALKAADVSVTGYRDGWGFSSVAWRQSDTLARLATIGPDVPVFSNAPEILYLHTARQAKSIPRSRFLMSRQPNLEFARQLAEVERQVRVQCGAVVYLRGLAQQSMPSETEIAQRLSLDVLSDDDDGMIWGVRACQR